MIVSRDSSGTDPTARGESSALVDLWHHQPGPPRRMVDRSARTELAPSFPSVPPILVPALLADLRHLDVTGDSLGPVKTASPNRFLDELNRFICRLPRGLPPPPAGPEADPKGDGKGKRAFAKAEKKAAAPQAAVQPQ